MMTVDPPVVQPSLGQIAFIVGVAAHRNPRPTSVTNNIYKSIPILIMTVVIDD